MAHVYSHHDEGAAVTVELKTNQQIAGSVSGRRSRMSASASIEPIDVAEMLANQAALDNGWRPRRRGSRSTGWRRCAAARALYGVNTRDISQGGVKVEIDEPLEARRGRWSLTPDRFRPIHGVVRWCQDGLAGIAFNQTIPFHELMSWLRPDRPRLAR